jgi:hypothetical protein
LPPGAGDSTVDGAGRAAAMASSAWAYMDSTVCRRKERVPGPDLVLVQACSPPALLVAFFRLLLDRSQTRTVVPGERANAQLKSWRIVRKLRCCPRRAEQLAKAIHVLHTREIGG